MIERHRKRLEQAREQLRKKIYEPKSTSAANFQGFRSNINRAISNGVGGQIAARLFGGDLPPRNEVVEVHKLNYQNIIKSVPYTPPLETPFISSPPAGGQFIFDVQTAFVVLEARIAAYNSYNSKINTAPVNTIQELGVHQFIAGFAHYTYPNFRLVAFSGPEGDEKPAYISDQALYLLNPDFDVVFIGQHPTSFGTIIKFSEFILTGKKGKTKYTSFYATAPIFIAYDIKIIGFVPPSKSLQIFKAANSTLPGGFNTLKPLINIPPFFYRTSIPFGTDMPEGNTGYVRSFYQLAGNPAKYKLFRTLAETVVTPNFSATYKEFYRILKEYEDAKKIDPKTEIPYYKTGQTTVVIEGIDINDNPITVKKSYNNVLNIACQSIFSPPVGSSLAPLMVLSFPEDLISVELGILFPSLFSESYVDVGELQYLSKLPPPYSPANLFPSIPSELGAEGWLGISSQPLDPEFFSEEANIPVGKFGPPPRQPKDVNFMGSAFVLFTEISPLTVLELFRKNLIEIYFPACTETFIFNGSQVDLSQFKEVTNAFATRPFGRGRCKFIMVDLDTQADLSVRLFTP